jgi:aminopeptidase YwaD
MRLVPVLLCAALLTACTDVDPPAGPSANPSPAATTGAPAPTTPSSPPPADEPPVSSEPAPEPPPEPPPEPERADPDDVGRATVVRTVRHLAVDIGPRPGTTRAFHEAAGWVADELRRLGWDVQQQSFPVPAGSSVAGPTEGLPVEAGRSTNVIATRGDLVRGEPWLAVGAHLDTVPTSPGAEDNASGIGALLAVAEAVTDKRTRLPVVLIAFGAEEPRGPGDANHHYGSRAYVASLTGAERRSLRGMVAMDRVGVGTVMPVGSVEDGDPLRAELLDAAARHGVPTVAESGNRSSDHWSFVRAGLPGVRLGSTPYAEYHSADDAFSVVDPAQVVRAARIVVAWLR